eukprot:CAMPEP_0175162086 /NCGR_PEP_ID=MMETSP0087-20121206/24965_1 /TAXON_ID=136419 /ORGANISM="Unknown Unknown, Strain D1" /LENGTH=427 /DNA_ID=CAMNT_0016450573 /DNA_START=178 /DNA_END=1461 /DNA_ORIENTATION=-
MAVVGLRDCPDNTRNRADFLDLNTGKLLTQQEAGSTVSVSHAVGNVAGVAWNKPKGVASVSLSVGRKGTTSWTTNFSASPAFWGPVSCSEDGIVFGVLLEPTPDEAHLNNRSAELLIYARNAQVPAYQLRVDGCGVSDPMVVSVSGYPSATGVYSVIAIMSTHIVVVDFDVSTSTGSLVFDKNDGAEVAPETAVAVSSTGNYFAVTSNNLAVDVYKRSGSARQTLFTKIAQLYAPSIPFAAVTPASLAFSSDPSFDPPFLAVAWDNGQGSAVAVTTYEVDGSKVKQIWNFTRTCSHGLDIVSSEDGLQVSSDGNFVVLGTWGCDLTNGDPNVAVFKGKGGDGKPLLSDSRPWYVWAVAVDTDPSHPGKAYVGAASWSSQTKAQPRRQAKLSESSGSPQRENHPGHRRKLATDSPSQLAMYTVHLPKD